SLEIAEDVEQVLERDVLPNRDRLRLDRLAARDGELAHRPHRVVDPLRDPHRVGRYPRSGSELSCPSPPERSGSELSCPPPPERSGSELSCPPRPGERRMVRDTRVQNRIWQILRTPTGLAQDGRPSCRSTSRTSTCPARRSSTPTSRARATGSISSA